MVKGERRVALVSKVKRDLLDLQALKVLLVKRVVKVMQGTVAALVKMDATVKRDLRAQEDLQDLLGKWAYKVIQEQLDLLVV